MQERTEMTQLAEEKQTYLSNFSHVEKQITSGDGRAPWLDALRRAGMERFAAVGFPTTKQEEWRFTNVAPIARVPFKPARAVEVSYDDIAHYSFRAEAACEIVFVNGHFSPALSSLRAMPRGVRVSSLASALQADADLIGKYLGKHADLLKNPFVALNTGFIADGAFIHIARGSTIETPIHLLFVSAPSKEPAVAHPRVLAVVEDRVSATIVESYVGKGRDGQYFTNAVTEIVTGNDCNIDHCKLQQESLDAFHVASMNVELGRSTNFVSHAATIGAKLSRNDLACVLDGDGAYATLNGLVVLSGEQHCDNNTLLRHEKPNCPSHELYKHVLNDLASGVFKGKIFVQKDAQKTNAKQASKSLLLSDDAVMNSMPALEIYADDVKCTHGSTIGPVDEDMVFYLRTRGVGYEAARHLLTYAFAADVTRRIRVEPVRRRLEDFLASQHGLPQDLRISDLGAHDEAVV